jgi:uncharacterized protein DUF3891
MRDELAITSFIPPPSSFRAMIRRTQKTADGGQAWMLISQVDHAHLAGELAASWGAGPFPPLVPRDQLLPAIDHHDDGWAEWERCPQVDAEHGRPIDFLEMQLADSLAIWQRSIDAAAAFGPLAAYVVSGHFSALLRRSNAWQPTTTPPAGATAFLDQQDRDRAHWLEAWQGADPVRNTPEVAEQGLKFLQFFDALSLWLCMAERHEPRSMATPGGPELTLTPRTQEVELRPWPWRVPELNVRVAGRAVPVARYESAQALEQAVSQTVVLSWRLMPAA